MSLVSGVETAFLEERRSCADMGDVSQLDVVVAWFTSMIIVDTNTRRTQTFDQPCPHTLLYQTEKSISVKDLWSGTTFNVKPSAGMVVPQVPANGGSFMFTMHQ